MADTDWIEIGRIVAPQGVRGEVRVYPSSDFPERFLDPGARWIQYPQRPNPEPVTLVKGRSMDGKGLYVIQLDGIDDRTQAEALRGCALLVPAADRPDLEAGEFYAADLMGLRAILQATGAEIGLVTDLYEAGNDLLEITLHPSAPDASASDQAMAQNSGAPLPQDSPVADRPKSRPKSRKVLVPFVEAIVPTVDLANGCLYLTPPDGLLDA
ncbi:ribosome maturation factor RimM [Leptolyngbya sp. BL0902]|uniref:ribosome maturation factor RimM n=1 Tax=Leptolyngbya sp. BL0902 TaxID=1115757 RepID=UPI0018E6E6D3|nr:ribosome maturation factor RimM [Leptolyngbya sp. BL0902]QQE65173.1 ribosome maturation factor RimM [Leptolyngbya sp. BL0902]